MRAVVAVSPEPLSWDEVPVACAGPEEVLLRVRPAGVNRADLLQAAGLYPPPPGASEIIGMEASGLITEVGERVSGWTSGQGVWALLAGGIVVAYLGGP